jgi:hypothetical protein
MHTFAGIPSAPGYVPNMLSNERPSLITNTACWMGVFVAGGEGLAAATGEVTDETIIALSAAARTRHAITHGPHRRR